MTTYAYFVDLSICAGCEACTVACQTKNGLDPSLTFTNVSRYQTGTFPDLASTFVTRQCLHCDNPPCADVCPTGATYKLSTGPVVVDDEKCISCKYCITACPYDARVIDEESNVVKKCTLCFDRLAEGQLPACVQTCLTGARQIGDLDDPTDPIHEMIKQPNTIKIEGTSFYYRIPEGISREAIPADFKGSGVTYAWQSILQPLGQWMLGGVAGAVFFSMLANTAKSVRKGGDADGHH